MCNRQSAVLRRSPEGLPESAQSVLCSMNFYNTHTRRWRGVSVGAIALALGVSAGCVELRTPDPDVRYVAFGDSTTKGPTPRDYPAILRELLDVPR